MGFCWCDESEESYLCCAEDADFDGLGILGWCWWVVDPPDAVEGADENTHFQDTWKIKFMER